MEWIYKFTCQEYIEEAGSDIRVLFVDSEVVGLRRQRY